ncbi:MAG: helix-turn-helix domain-containing protein [Corynebacterium sp.]|nr:helix-turn-helix domain-containing protein [Corynebacterium sp.]
MDRPDVPAQSRQSRTDTRAAVLRQLHERGSLTAAELAAAFSLTVPGVRRHLEALLADGLIEVAPHVGEIGGGQRGRGRPPVNYRLTDAGRDQFGHNYDELAMEALAALRDLGGAEAVSRFAERRVGAILADVEPTENPVDSAKAVAEAFRRYGYAAEVRESMAGVQLCTHHCPVSEVAAQFPQLCAAEQDAIATFMGQRIQPLATIAGGHGVCTTNISLGTHPRARTHQPASHHGEETEGDLR